MLTVDAVLVFAILGVVRSLWLIAPLLVCAQGCSDQLRSTACRQHTDCRSGAVCKNGLCATACIDRFQCPVGQDCVGGVCVSGQNGPGDAGGNLCTDYDTCETFTSASACPQAPPDICDGVNQDCDTELDEDPDIIWYHDADGDGFANHSDTQLACTDPDGPGTTWTAAAGAPDCADVPTSDPNCNGLDGAACHPGLAGADGCDGADNDCDTQVDEDCDPRRIYWTDDTAIRSARRDGTGLTDVITGLVNPTGVAVDVSGDRIYWTDLGVDEIHSAQLDGSDDQTLHSPLGATSLRGMTLDLPDSRFYWVDAGTDNVRRAMLNGGGRQTVIGGLPSPNGVAVDTTGAYVYWTDPGEGTVRRANKNNGSDPLDLATLRDEPRGIALDLVNDRVYWTEAGVNPSIQRANLDGTSRVPLITADLTSPNGIAVDAVAGRIFWIDSGSLKIESAGLDGAGRTVVLDAGLNAPRHIALEE